MSEIGKIVKAIRDDIEEKISFIVVHTGHPLSATSDLS